VFKRATPLFLIVSQKNPLNRLPNPTSLRSNLVLSSHLHPVFQVVSFLRVSLCVSVLSHTCWSRDSSIGKVTSYGLDGGTRFVSSPQGPHLFWGPSSLLSNGYRVLSTGVKRLGREADHSPPFCAEVKNGGAIPPFPHMSSWHSA
jgi:hypothetical protein